MSKKIFLSLIGIAVALVVFLMTVPITNPINKSQYSNISINGVDVDDEELVQELIETISYYKVVRKLCTNPTYLIDEQDYLIVINGDGEKPLHIILGDENRLYYAGNIVCYSFPEQGNLISELNNIIE